MSGSLISYGLGLAGLRKRTTEPGFANYYTLPVHSNNIVSFVYIGFSGEHNLFCETRNNNLEL